MSIRGNIFESGHQSVARSLIGDYDIQVVSKGSSFYNKTPFQILYFLKAFADWCQNHPDQPIRRSDINIIVKEARKEVKQGEKKIVIASTPEWVSREVRNRLDGGLIHEIFHSLYTSEDDQFNHGRLFEILDQYYRKDIPYGQKKGLLKQLWNVYEDAFIEHRGIEEFKGARKKLQTIHEYVWEREGEIRDLPLEDPEGMSPIDHFTCCLRDRLKDYLNRRPVEEYDEDVRQILDDEFEDLIERGRKSQSSYKSFELAVRTLNRLDSIFPDQDDEPEIEIAVSGGEGDPSDDDDLEPKGEEEGGQSEGESQPEDREDSSSGDSDEQGGDQTDDDQSEGGGSGQDEEDRSEGEDEGEEEGSGGGENRGGGDREDGGEEGGEDDERGADEDGGEDGDETGSDTRGSGDEGSSRRRKIINHLSRSVDSNHPKDIRDALQDLWDDSTSGEDIPPGVHPYSREMDTVEHVQPDDEAEAIEEFRDVTRQLKKETLYLRPKMMALLRGQRESRLRHRQESGRRLSSRSISEVVYRDEPRPFVSRETTEQTNACCSLILDESSSMSMGGEIGKAKKIIATMAMTVGDLRIPHEIVGFSTNGQKVRRVKDKKRFTRTCGVGYRVFREFDDPFTARSWSSLSEAVSRRLTPIPDAIDWSARRILKRDEERKALIVVTDGKPFYSNFSYLSKGDHIELMDNQVEELARLGVHTMFIGVDSSASFVEKYPNSVVIESPENLGKGMTEFLHEQIKKIKQISD